MSISLIQTKTGTATASTTVAGTFTSNTSNGDSILLVIARTGSTTVSSITDSQSNPYTFIQTNSGSRLTDFYYARNIVGGTTPTFTVTFSGSDTALIIARDYSSTLPLLLDVNTFSSGSGTAVSSGTTASTTNANELVTGWAVNPNVSSFVVGSGYGNLVSSGFSTINLGMEDKIVAATGAQTATFTQGSGAWAAGIATFYESAAAPTMRGISSITGISAVTF